MSTIFDGDDIEWVRFPAPPDFVPPTIRQLLARGFDEGAKFYVCDGRPFVVWPMLDWALDWSVHPVREVHPFYPVLNGKKITEREFRTLVSAMHCVY
jgi:hypothetical protein